MKGTTWHVCGPIGKRELTARFDAGLPNDLDRHWYIPLRAQYFDDLQRAAKRVDIAWLPASGDVYVFSSDPASREHVDATLLGIVNDTQISYELPIHQAEQGAA